MKYNGITKTRYTNVFFGVPSTGQTIKYRPFLSQRTKDIILSKDTKDEQTNQMYQVMSDVVNLVLLMTIDTEKHLSLI